jgi:endoglucanase
MIDLTNKPHLFLCSLVASFMATCLLTASPAAFAQLPKPTYGWNLGNTMEPPSGVGTWGGSPTQALIKSVAVAGFNTIRIPCAWDCHANQTTYQIDPAYMAQVKQVVDWSYANGLYVVVNDHWDHGWLENNIGSTVNPVINLKMKAYWTQIAKAFAGYNNQLLFAGANEPNASTAAQMSTLLAYYQTYVNAVRATGGNNTSRWLIVEGPGADIDKTSTLMTTLPTDTAIGRLMVEVHYYSPSQLTILGSDASWGKVFYFWGQGYHSSANPARNATWGDETYLTAEFAKVYSQFTSKGIPVMLGEFGAYKRTNLTGADYDLNYASTTYWDMFVVNTAHCYGLDPVAWSTPGGLFDWSTGAVKDQSTINSLTGGRSLPPPGGDGAEYCFELSSQNWTTTGAPITGVATSTLQKCSGSQSLAVMFNGSAGTAAAWVASPPAPAGKTITFHVWIPAGSKISAVQPYEMDKNLKLVGSSEMIKNFKTNKWNVITVKVPPHAAEPLQKLGVQFTTSARWSGTCYIDAVGW